MARSIRHTEQDADAPAQPAPDSDPRSPRRSHDAATGAALHPVAGGQPEPDAWPLPAGHAEIRGPAARQSGDPGPPARAADLAAGAQGRPAAGRRPADPAAGGAGRRARRPQRPTGAPAAGPDQRAHPALRAPARRPLSMRAGRAAAGRAGAGGASRERRRHRAAARRHRRTIYRPRPVRPPAAALRPARRPGGRGPGAQLVLGHARQGLADLRRGPAGRGADQPVRARQPAVHHERLRPRGAEPRDRDAVGARGRRAHRLRVRLRAAQPARLLRRQRRPRWPTSSWPAGSSSR